MEYKSGRVYDKVKFSRGKAKTIKKYIFEDEDDFKEIKNKMVDFVKEKSFELKGFVEETTESAKDVDVETINHETAEMVDSDDEEDFEEAETVEMVESDDEIDFDEDFIAGNE